MFLAVRVRERASGCVRDDTKGTQSGRDGGGGGGISVRGIPGEKTEENIERGRVQIKERQAIRLGVVKVLPLLLLLLRRQRRGEGCIRGAGKSINGRNETRQRPSLAVGAARWTK